MKTVRNKTVQTSRLSLSTLREDNIHEAGALSWGVQMVLFAKTMYGNFEKNNFLFWITMESPLL